MAPTLRASNGRANDLEDTEKAPSEEGAYLLLQVKRVNLERVVVGRVGLEPTADGL